MVDISFGTVLPLLYWYSYDPETYGPPVDWYSWEQTSYWVVEGLFHLETHILISLALNRKHPTILRHLYLIGKVIDKRLLRFRNKLTPVLSLLVVRVGWKVCFRLLTVPSNHSLQIDVANRNDYSLGIFPKDTYGRGYSTNHENLNPTFNQYRWICVWPPEWSNMENENTWVKEELWKKSMTRWVGEWTRHAATGAEVMMAVRKWMSCRIEEVNEFQIQWNTQTHVPQPSEIITHARRNKECRMPSPLL